MKQVISFILTFLLLLSSSGITYAQHFCGEYEMMSQISLGEKHLSCGMVMQKSACNDEDTDHDCCSNEYTNVEIDDTLTVASSDFSLNKTFVASVISVFVLDLPIAETTNTVFFTDYSPPPLGEDLQILYQSFLI